MQQPLLVAVPSLVSAGLGKLASAQAGLCPCSCLPACVQGCPAHNCDFAGSQCPLALHATIVPEAVCQQPGPRRSIHAFLFPEAVR